MTTKPKPRKRAPAKRAKVPTVGQSAIAGLREGLAHMRGERVPGLVVRKPVDVAAVRKATGLSQDRVRRRVRPCRRRRARMGTEAPHARPRGANTAARDRI